MTVEEPTQKRSKIYGAGMTPYGVFLFAQTYRANADGLALVAAKVGPRMSDHPRRFLYFQALEHYLRSFLWLKGKEPAEIRAYNHNFSGMLDDSKALGLVVPKAVGSFIQSRTVANDYTRIRYDHQLDDPEDPNQQPPPMAQLQRAVRVLENAVGRAIRATGIEVTIPGDLKLSLVAGC